MNGAEILARTLLACGIDTVFANPGTSEMHFLSALDRVDGIRCVLGLFEGVVTGAADGYARMAETPAGTLLHLGPGLANGLANLHNANRASTPVVNIIGDHATYHRRYDAPLTSDIEAAARPFCHWVHTVAAAADVGAAGVAAVAAARKPPGQIAALILPADTAWTDVASPRIGSIAELLEQPARVSPDAISNAVRVLSSGEPAALLVAGAVMRQRGLEIAERIAVATGAKLMGQTGSARIERGVGRPEFVRIPYVVDQARAVLSGLKHIILVAAKPPVAFFAHPGKPSVLSPEDCQIHVLTTPSEDSLHALEWLADELGAGTAPVRREAYERCVPATGNLTPDALGASLAAFLPENAIVVDESITTGRSFFKSTQHARPHDWLQNMGGSIGIGMPLATGAAVACPERKVVCLEGDGSAMYTLQALWTQAREGLDVTTVIFANRSYAILHGELKNVGVQKPGPNALGMLDIDRPTIDWVGLSSSMGVDAARVETMEDFNRAFSAAMQVRGPTLIEVVL